MTLSPPLARVYLCETAREIRAQEASGRVWHHGLRVGARKAARGHHRPSVARLRPYPISL